MKIQERLHKLLFPSKVKSYENLVRLLKTNQEEYVKERINKPTNADLMRENLGSLVLDFTKNPDYLEGIDEAERKDRIVQANELYKNKMFGIIYEHLVNKQGNFTLKQAINDAQIFTGRMSINGMTLLKNEVDRCHMLFEEMVIPEQFDPQEVL